MPTNDFLPFASSGTANVMPQADYAALSARTAGFSSGIAKSQELNKVWRQSSLVAAAVARVIAEVGGRNAVDDGSTDALVAGIIAAMKATCLPNSGGVVAGNVGVNGSLAVNGVPVDPASKFDKTGGEVTGTIRLRGDWQGYWALNSAGQRTAAFYGRPDFGYAISGHAGNEAEVGKLECSAANNWLLEWGGKDLGRWAAIDISNTLAGTGFQKLPGGTILQWGSGSVGAGGSTPVTFGAAFPNNCFRVIVSIEYGGSGTPSAATACAGSITRTGFSLGTSVGPLAYSYLAIGN